jgi:phosphoribosylaminoimidazole-succinocarboxamide synthase
MPGGAQQSFDKQYIRDYLRSIAWDKKPPGPSLPADIIQNTFRKYQEALNWLAGK